VNDNERIVELEVIDLSERREPTLVDAVRSPAVRDAATRALHELEARHDDGPWVAVCTETAEVVAASRSVGPDVVDGVWEEFDRYTRWECDRVPLVVLGLGAIRSASPDSAAYAAAVPRSRRRAPSKPRPSPRPTHSPGWGISGPGGSGSRKRTPASCGRRRRRSSRWSTSMT
jgi:hypothetical protein